MEEIEGYYTFGGIRRQKDDNATAAMEDYLEMIYRADRDQCGIRVKELADLLHVKPSSVSRMMANLRQEGWVTYAHYEKIRLTEDGRKLGEYLLYRHNVVYRFLCLLNGDEDQLQQTERIEHFLDRRTVDNLHKIVDNFFELGVFWGNN